ncbi:MAG: signal peptidase II [Clostridia bacterium]|nr:signal peptidase II [Clostridia bacterium]
MFQFTVLAITAALVSLDQLTKWLAVLSLKNAETITLIPKVLGLTYVENAGAAFGILQGQRWFFLILTGVVMAAILWLLLFGKFRKYLLFNISATLIVAGGIGNFIDRLIHGYVVDFIEVLFFEFPVFNVADCFVVVGSVLLLVFFLFIYDDKKVPIAGKTEATHEDDSTDRTN